MKFLKSHFALSRSQRNGIFALVILIILLQIVLFNIDFFSEDPLLEDEQEVEMFRHKLDSLQENPTKKNKDTIYPFNPNFLTDYRGYLLGMSPTQIDRLLEHRAQDKWVNSAEEFQKVTKVSDSVLQRISVYFKFPYKKINYQRKPGKQAKSTSEKIIDLNVASAEEFKLVNGVGTVLSERIVKYRNSIGGFRGEIQIKDVYGLKPEVVERILSKFKILNKTSHQKRDINTATATQLAEIPYFNYQLAQQLVEYRKLRGRIDSFEELAKIDGFPIERIDRIKLYLALN